MVAINLTLAFQSRWLFAFNNAERFATVPELMQAVARAPRGVSAADRAWQMREHWVNILIKGMPPTLADFQRDQERQRALAKDIEDRSKALGHEGERLTRQAKAAAHDGLQLHGELASDPAPSYGDELNRLRASVELFKDGHNSNRWVALRYMELGIKNGFEPPEPMPALTPAEVAVNNGMALLTREAVDDEARVKEMNNNDAVKYAWLVEERLPAEARAMVERDGWVGVDEDVAIETVQERFWEYDEASLWKNMDTDTTRLLPTEIFMRRVYFTLRRFVFVGDDDTPINGFMALSKMKGSADGAFEYICGRDNKNVERLPAAERLGRLRAKGVVELRAEEGAPPDAKKLRPHRQAQALTLLEVVNTIEAVAGKLELSPESAVDELLRHGAHFEATPFWQEEAPAEGAQGAQRVVDDFDSRSGVQRVVDSRSGVQRVVDAANLMTWFGFKNDKNQVDYDRAPPVILAFCDALRGAVQTMRSSGATKQMKPHKLLECALAPFGLRVDADMTSKVSTPSGGKCELIASVTIVEPSVDDLGVSLADAYGIYSRELGQGVLRSDAYRKKRTEQAHLDAYARSRASGCDSPPPPDPRPSKAPRPLLSNLAPELHFNPVRRRFETYDAAGVAVLLADLRGDGAHRQRTLEAIEAAINKEVKEGRADGARCAQLEKWQRELWRCKDLHAMVEAVARLDLAYGCHGQWVEYQKDGLGRRYARGELTAPRVHPAKLSRLPSADALDPNLAGTVDRTVAYQPMLRDLRAPLGGARLYDADMVKACPSIAWSLARQNGYPEEKMARVAEYACHGASWLAAVGAHHACTKEAAKALMQAALFGDNINASFEQWKKEHGVTQGALMGQVREFNRQVIAFRDWAFATLPLVFETPRERLREREPQWSERKLDRSLFASWLFNGEDEVLVLIGQVLVRLGWAVVALIFDGLLLGVGSATDAAGSATDAAGSATDTTGGRLRADLRKVEGDLQQKGWRVALDLKPLHGEQGAAVPTIEEARAAVAAFEASG